MQNEIEIFRLPGKIPPRAQTIIALRYFMGPRKIASRMRMTVEAVRYYLKKYDPEKLAVKGDLVRKCVLSSMVDTLTWRMLASIKPEDIENPELKLTEKVAVLKDLVRVSDAMGARRQELPQEDRDVVAALRNALPQDEDDDEGAEDAAAANNLGDFDDDDADLKDAKRIDLGHEDGAVGDQGD